MAAVAATVGTMVAQALISEGTKKMMGTEDSGGSSFGGSSMPSFGGGSSSSSFGGDMMGTMMNVGMNMLGNKQEADHNSDLISLQMKQAQDNANSRIKEINERSAIEESQRLRNLKSVIARQRASFGARGLSSTGGSSQAVLNGLLTESEESKKAQERLDRLKKQAISDGLHQSNLLALSQQNGEKSFFNLF